MEDTNTKLHPLKKIDRAIFEQIDKFKTTPNYTVVTDFYNGIEEEQQKLVKGAIMLALFLIPLSVLAALWLENQNIREDYEIRLSIMNKAQQIIGESRGVTAVSPQIISQAPIDSEGMLTSRISNAVGGSGFDMNKLSRGEFSTSNVSEKIFQTEAQMKFSNVSNDELMNLFTSLIRREKMRISEVAIDRNAETGLLSGNFRLVHLSLIQLNEGE